MHELVHRQCQAWQAAEIGREQQDPDTAAYATPEDQSRQSDKQCRTGDKRRHDIDLELRARLVDNILCPLKLRGDAVTLQRRKQQRPDEDVVIYAPGIRCGAGPGIEALRRQDLDAQSGAGRSRPLK